MKPFERGYIKPEDHAILRTTGKMRDPIVMMNDEYQVFVDWIPKSALPDGWPCEMYHLSIKRNDRDVIRDWRDLQQIKNMICGSECEGVELFPAESRLVDSANQFHMWVLSNREYRFPFGFNERVVADAVHSPSMPKVRQRPFKADERPADCIGGDELERMLKGRMNR